MIEKAFLMLSGFGFGVAFATWWLLEHVDKDRLMEITGGRNEQL